MDRRTRKSVYAFTVLAVLLFTLLSSPILFAPSRAAGDEHRTRAVPIYRTRQLVSDLEVTGMIAGLPSGAIGYVLYTDLAKLPSVTASIHGDEDFSEISKEQTIRVKGVYLDVLAEALRVYRDSDLIDATCTDNYRGHYPRSYIEAHHPILVLGINNLRTADWAMQTHRWDPGPYFVAHANFIPAFHVLSHSDRPQVPANVVRINFTTTGVTFGPISPSGNFASIAPEEEGFAIAKQNCLRCHNQGRIGGSKAGRSWMMLSTWAREQPAYFAAYVKNPKSFEMHAKMPENPSYDAATLAALTAYFRTFTMPPLEGGR